MNLQEQIHRINEMMYPIKEIKEDSIENIIKKFYIVDFNTNFKKPNILLLEMILTPKSKSIFEEYGKSYFHSAWKKNTHIGQSDWKLEDVNSAYVDNDIFKTMGILLDLEKWMMKKSIEYVKSM